MSWGASEYGQRGNGESGFEAEAKEKEPNRPPRDEPALVPSLEHVTAVSSGGSDFALLENGTLMAWGDNSSGALGLGEGPVAAQPVDASAAATAAEMASLPDRASFYFTHEPGGHMGVTVSVNNHQVPALFDTGAGACGDVPVEQSGGGGLPSLQ